MDGQTAGENVQSGLIGEGWTLGAGGFIESTFRPCSQDLDHTPRWTDSTPDPCVRLENYQLSWSGSSDELAPTGSGNLWKVGADDGARIELLDDQGTGKYWRITTTDGTQWFFGRQRLPGWTSGARETGSVLSQEAVG